MRTSLFTFFACFLLVIGTVSNAGASPDIQAWQSEHAIPWGSTGVTVTLKLPLDFDLFVVDEKTRDTVPYSFE